MTSWGTLAFVALVNVTATQEWIAVSFRGSADLINWLADFDFVEMTPVEYCDGCKVHTGFYRSWLSVARLVSEEVSRLRAAHPHAQLVLTGHSLGAAMAILAATHLHYNDDLGVHAVYTFGQPRVGNRAFHEYFAAIEEGPAIAYRVVHWRDPVAISPPRWLDGDHSFVHVGTEVWYTEDSSTHTLCTWEQEDGACSESLGLDPLRATDHVRYLGYTQDMSSCDAPYPPASLF